jgi:hypothetical protein
MVEADIEKADFTNHDIFITEIIARMAIYSQSWNNIDENAK